MPALQLQSRQQPLAVPPAAGVELEGRLALFEEQGGVVAAVADPEKAEVLLEDGVLGGELGGPGECDVLVLALPGEVVDGEHDEETDADDLDGEGTGSLGVFGGGRGSGIRGIVIGGFGIGGDIAVRGGVFDGEAFEFVLVPEIEGGGGGGWFGEIGGWGLRIGGRDWIGSGFGLGVRIGRGELGGEGLGGG